MRKLRLSAGRGLTLGASAVVALGLLSGVASAATISVTKPCYVNPSSSKRASLTVLGSGFAPGLPVTITSSAGSVQASATASATGTIDLVTAAPKFTLPDQETVTLTAQQSSSLGGPLTATTPVTVAARAVGIVPSMAQPSQRVTWYFAGFIPGKLVFGHFLRDGQIALLRFGRARGACGVLKARAQLFPGGHPKKGIYDVQFDDSRRYSKHTSPRIDRKLEFSVV